MQPDLERADTAKMWKFLFFAWVVALVSTVSAIFIGEVMGQIPCNLCWYQRILMFPLALILAIALYRNDMGIWRYGIALSGLGLLVATFHSFQYFGLLPETIKPCMSEGPSCSGVGMTLWGVLPLPVLAALAFLLIILCFVQIRRISK